MLLDRHRRQSLGKKEIIDETSCCCWRHAWFTRVSKKYEWTESLILRPTTRRLSKIAAEIWNSHFWLIVIVEGGDVAEEPWNDKNLGSRNF